MEELLIPLLMEWSNRIYDRVILKWHSQAASIKGNAETHPVIIENVYGALVARLGFSGQAAWIAEYGKGSMMDLNNPYRDEYKASDNYNPARIGNYITGRPAGSYTDLDGTPQKSAGGKEGVILEGKSPVFSPSAPMHIIEQEIDNALPEIEEELISVSMDYISTEFYNAFPKKIVIG